MDYLLPSVHLGELFLRGTVTYIGLMLLFRIVGRREAGNRKAMHREFMTEDEVLSQLRLHGIEDITHIQRAYIEPNGMVSIILQRPQQTSDSPKPPGL